MRVNENSGTHRRKPGAVPIAGVFIFLCIVGFVTILVFCFNATKDLLDNKSKKLEYEKMLLPVVMFDPVPFEGADKFDQVALLQTCVWATLLGDKGDAYSYDDYAQLVVPAIDVDVTAQKLFGPDVKLEHQDFGSYEELYFYDQTIKSYRVPITTMTGFFTPKVTEITRRGDVVTLRVGYVPPSTALNISFDRQNTTPDPVKYMIYELHKAKTGYYIYAIRDVEGTIYSPEESFPDFTQPDTLEDGELFGPDDAANPEGDILPGPSESPSSVQAG